VRLARRSLALRPAHSRRHLYVTRYTEGFSHFVTSMTAPVASGWSVRRVGLSPTGKRRLLTAHANSGRSLTWVTALESFAQRPHSSSRKGRCYCCSRSFVRYRRLATSVGTNGPTEAPCSGCDRARITDAIFVCVRRDARHFLPLARRQSESHLGIATPTKRSGSI
jgi:hypothetical protein